MMRIRLIGGGIVVIVLLICVGSIGGHKRKAEDNFEQSEERRSASQLDQQVEQTETRTLPEMSPDFFMKVQEVLGPVLLSSRLHKLVQKIKQLIENMNEAKQDTQNRESLVVMDGFSKHFVEEKRFRENVLEEIEGKFIGLLRDFYMGLNLEIAELYGDGDGKEKLDKEEGMSYETTEELSQHKDESKQTQTQTQTQKQTQTQTQTQKHKQKQKHKHKHKHKTQKSELDARSEDKKQRCQRMKEVVKNEIRARESVKEQHGQPVMKKPRKEQKLAGKRKLKKEGKVIRSADAGTSTTLLLPSTSAELSSSSSIPPTPVSTAFSRPLFPPQTQTSSTILSPPFPSQPSTSTTILHPSQSSKPSTSKSFLSSKPSSLPSSSLSIKLTKPYFPYNPKQSYQIYPSISTPITITPINSQHPSSQSHISQDLRSSARTIPQNQFAQQVQNQPLTFQTFQSSQPSSMILDCSFDTITQQSSYNQRILVYTTQLMKIVKIKLIIQSSNRLLIQQYRRVTLYTDVLRQPQRLKISIGQCQQNLRDHKKNLNVLWYMYRLHVGFLVMVKGKLQEMCKRVYSKSPQKHQFDAIWLFYFRQQLFKLLYLISRVCKHHFLHIFQPQRSLITNIPPLPTNRNNNLRPSQSELTKTFQSLNIVPTSKQQKKKLSQPTQFIYNPKHPFDTTQLQIDLTSQQQFLIDRERALTQSTANGYLIMQILQSYISRQAKLQYKFQFLEFLLWRENAIGKLQWNLKYYPIVINNMEMTIRRVFVGGQRGERGERGRGVPFRYHQMFTRMKVWRRRVEEFMEKVKVVLRDVYKKNVQ